MGQQHETTTRDNNMGLNNQPYLILDSDIESESESESESDTDTEIPS